MLVTRKQRLMLAVYRKYHRGGISLWRIYRLCGWRIAVVPVYFTLAAVLCFAYGINWAGLLLVGFGAGAVLRDLAYFRRSVAVWPLIEEITDWDRVDQLFDDKASPTDVAPRPFPHPADLSERAPRLGAPSPEGIRPQDNTIIP